MSPEIINSKTYIGTDADLFAAGVTLFNLLTKESPFISTSKDDSFYKCIRKNRPDIFWKTHEKILENKGKKEALSEEVKDLITSMLQY